MKIILIMYPPLHGPIIIPMPRPDLTTGEGGDVFEGGLNGKKTERRRDPLLTQGPFKELFIISFFFGELMVEHGALPQFKSVSNKKSFQSQMELKGFYVAAEGLLPSRLVSHLRRFHRT